jgi:quinol-cytochrome oxidoreductase complex cytochrome b subunit
MKPNFYYHLHPPTIPEKQARFRYTLGAGGIAVYLTLLVVISGGLEMFYYIPVVDEAALSIQTITFLIPLGSLTRNLHYWSSQLLIIISMVHLVRVVFTGAYAEHRRFNYLLGLGLFLLVLLFDFTGYILRWDIGIQWALVVGTNLIKTIPIIGERIYQMLVGGEIPGQSTLIRFYAWHVFGLAVITGILLVWHIFRVRHDGGIAVPHPAKRETRRRISRHELIMRELLMMIIFGMILLLVSAFLPAPIAPPITEITTITGDAQAPWFLLWVQYLLRWGDPFLWGIIIPVLFLIVVGLFPFVLPKPSIAELGKWFPKSNRLAQMLLAAILILIFVLTVLK